MKSIAYLVIALILAGVVGSCKEHPITPPNPIDTTQPPCDTCKKPCDTCNKPIDSISHAFTWVESTIPGENALSRCWVFGVNKIWAVGGDIHEWNGLAWKTLRYHVNTHGRPLDGVFADHGLFAFAPNDAWIIGSSIAWHLGDGFADEYRLSAPTQWDTGLSVLKPDDGRLHACWGTSSKDMFFVGDKGTIVHFDGKDWINYPKVTTKNLLSVQGTSHDNVWATGTNTSTGDVVLLHFDGTSWTENDLPTNQFAKTGGLYNVWCINDTGQTRVVVSGGYIFRSSNGVEWTHDEDAVLDDTRNITSDVMYLLSGNRANDLMTAGSWGYILHWNGRTWRRFDDFFQRKGNDPYPRGMHMNGNTACIVGFNHSGPWLAIGQRK
jgi:hypothetical protein